ncbi:hypothetical protein AV521_20770 [Streptomyces sp. IMTB 2501]|uniref:hypothetical protein n=1 Tax=Streptomyces sp. IMTB 2501 TaxID=1776340 RepID=UPI00096F86A7|nr:hypothetical protein [Streptomyces sp. IMTB 2501]OLZ68578.1 hypothetical protein AV521_20770 [Streptomyces sp. IMTB 2501]
MSGIAGLTRSRTWLRVLALLLALWVPCIHAQAQAAPALGLSAEAFEHEVLDSLVRPPDSALHQADAPERPAPLSDPAPVRPTARLCAGAPRVPYAPSLLRTVVLRC